MDSLPEDMEDRRLADLQRFARNHPDHPQVKRAELGEPEAEVDLGGLEEGSWHHWLRECQQLKPVSKGKRQFSGTQGAINKWDKASSLELLGAMKKFEDSLAELSIRGIRVTSDSRWTTIAQNVPNRYGLEPAKFTRSCKLHFANLCRIYKVPRRNSRGEDLSDPQVRRALEEYFEVGGENVPPFLRRKGSQVKSSANGGENVNTSNVPTEKIDPGDEHLRMAGATRIAVKKHWNTMPHRVVNGGSTPQVMKATARPHNKDSWKGPDYRINENTKGSDKIRGANAERHGQERRNSQRREQHVNPPTMDRTAPLKRWDTAKTLQLLAAMARVGAKAENRWETIASQVSNHGKLDPQEHMRSCKEQYRGLLSVYKRASCKEDSGHKLLADEVYAQLENLLQVGTTSKASNLRNTEIPRIEKQSTAPERVAAKPAFKSVVTEKKKDQEWMGITKDSRLNKKKWRGAVEENPEKLGFMKVNHGLQNREGLDHHVIGIANGSSWNDAGPLDAEDESEMQWDEYRKSINKRSREQQMAPFTGKKGKLQQGDVRQNRICKTYIDILFGRSSELEGNKIPESNSPNCEGLNQSVSRDKASSKDKAVHVESTNRGTEGGVSRGGASLQRTWRGPVEEEKKNKKNLDIGVSKRIFSNEETIRKGKLKTDWQGDAKGKRAIKVAESNNSSSSDDSIHSEDTCQVNSGMVKKKSTYLKGMQKATANISHPGKRIFRSGPQKHMTNHKLLHAAKCKVDMNSVADRSGKCVGPDRGKFKLGSDSGESSWDDSMQVEEDDSVMDGAESRRKTLKRLKILKRMTKKRAERAQAEKNGTGGDQRRSSAP